MAHDIVHATETPADQVRKALDQAERALPLLRTEEAAALDLLRTLDQIWAFLPALEREGVDVRAELGRWEALQRAVRARASVIAVRIGAWTAARQQAQAVPERWWWYLDAAHAAARRRLWLRRTGAAAALILVVVALVMFLRARFPVDPNVAAAQDRRLQAERHVANGEWAAALEQFGQAAAFTPNDPEVLIWQGVASEQMGQEAEPFYAQAQALLGDPVRFYIERGFIRLQANQPLESERDAQAALALDAGSAQAAYVLAGALEMQRRLAEAIEAYNRTAVLADETDASLAAAARLRMGMLLQSEQIQSMQPPTPAP